jgi:hypothetical protein
LEAIVSYIADDSPTRAQLSGECLIARTKLLVSP